MPEITVRQLSDPSEEELQKLAIIGNLAFQDAPIQLSFVDGDLERHGLFQYGMLSLLAKLGDLWVASYDGEEIVGMAAWIGPGVDLSTEPEHVSEMLGQLLPEGSQALPWAGYMMAKCEAQYDNALGDGTRARSWYLLQLAVHPQFQQKGIGSELLKPIHGKAQKERLLTCLETDKAENLPFYLKHGYTVRSEEEYETLVGTGRCSVWVLAKDPTPSRK